MAKVYLGLGSNVGNKLTNIKKTVSHLKKILKVKKISPVYKTEPVGYKHQDWFLNCVVEAETHNKALELLNLLKSIEKKLKRKKTFKYGPRTIDIDIIFYGDKLIKTKKLTIPHPRLHKRLFVLEPLNEICPGFVHPILKKTIAQLRKNFKQKNGVELYKP